MLEHGLMRITSKRFWVRMPFYVEYLLHLAPVILVSIVFLFLRESVLSSKIGNKTFSEFIQVVAISVPWLTQLACMPLYASIGNKVYRHGRRIIPSALIGKIPIVFSLSLLFVILLTPILRHYLAWDDVFTRNYVISCALHILFAQLMIFAVMLKKWPIWICAWIIYSLAFILFPEIWYLPPLLSALFNLFFLLKKLTVMPKIEWESKVLGWMTRGLVTGLVLWLDKILLFVMRPQEFNSSIVFFSLIPNILVVNYFYILKSPLIEKHLTRTIEMISKGSIEEFLALKLETYNVVRVSLINLLVINFFISGICLVLASLIYPSQASLIHVTFLFSLILTFSIILLNVLVLVKAYWHFSVFGVTYLTIVTLLFMSTLPLIAILNSLLVILIISAFILYILTLKRWTTPHRLFFYKG